MSLFCRRCGERCADVLDWIDYRPDADFRPLLGVPILLGLGWALGGTIGFGLVLSFALVVVALTVVVGLASLVAWIAAHLFADVVATVRLPSTRVPVSSPRRA